MSIKSTTYLTREECINRIFEEQELRRRKLISLRDHPIHRMTDKELEDRLEELCESNGKPLDNFIVATVDQIARQFEDSER